MPTTTPSAALGVSASSSRASSPPRPVKLAASRGRVLVAAAAAAPGAASRTAASTSAAGARPRAAATNRSRAGLARPSAPASSSAVSLRAVRWMPRSRSLTDRGDSPAASASSSWVSFAPARSCRSNPASPSPGRPATAPALLKPRPRHRPARAGLPPKAYADPLTPATPPAPASPAHLVPRPPSWSCRPSCGPSRVVNLRAAGDGGTSCDTQPPPSRSASATGRQRTRPGHDSEEPPKRGLILYYLVPARAAERQRQAQREAPARAASWARRTRTPRRGGHPSTAPRGGESRAAEPTYRRPGGPETPARHASGRPAAAPGAAVHGAGQRIPPRRAGPAAHAARATAHAARPPPGPAAEPRGGAMIAPLRRPRRHGRARTVRSAHAARAPRRQIMVTGRFTVRGPFHLWPTSLAAADRPGQVSLVPTTVRSRATGCRWTTAIGGKRASSRRYGRP